MTNRIVANRGMQYGGVHVDRAGHVYIVDSGNNRILGFRRMEGGDQNADLVFGQPSLADAGTANGDNTCDAAPTAQSLALQAYPTMITPLESARFIQLATDVENNLYVMDLQNNRVLKYDDPFATDVVADDVWGQSSFAENRGACGGAGAEPSSSTLCTESEPPTGGFNGNFGAGADIDPDGYLWVTDTGNHRVLRFPPGSKSADLVLGQGDFHGRETIGGPGHPRDRIVSPIGVRVKPSTGEVYVHEGRWAGENRIMVFAPPFANGMTASRVIGEARHQDDPPSDMTSWEYIEGKWVYLPSGLHWARGFAFDPSGAGDVWVNDGANHRVVLFDTSGVMVDVIGQPSFDRVTCTESGGAGYVTADGGIAPWCDCWGDIGVDPDGNLLVSKLYIPLDISRFPLPLQRTSQGLPRSDARLLFEPDGPQWNHVSGRTFSTLYGLAASPESSPSQLYVADGHRILVFNDYHQSLTYQEADHVIGQERVDLNREYTGGLLHGQTVGAIHAAGGYLFVAAGLRIYVFRTPITSSGTHYPTAAVLTTDDNLVWADDHEPVSFHVYFGLHYDVVADALWVSDDVGNRVLRIHHPLGEAVVDLVLGQPDKMSTGDNASEGPVPNDHGIGFPGFLALDHARNLYVVDGTNEGFVGGTNNRVMRFAARDVEPATHPGVLFPLPAAAGVYAKRGFQSTESWGPGTPGIPIAVAFDSQDRMLLSADSYGNTQYERLFFYERGHNADVTPQPASIVPIPVGQVATTMFDPDDGRLIVADGSWCRVLFVTVPALVPVEPVGHGLQLAGPNPAIRQLEFTVTVPSGGTGHLDLFDLAGRRVYGLRVESQGAGSHALRIPEDVHLSPGLYVARFAHGGQVASRRVVLLR